MSKNILHDIMPGARRTIRSVPLAAQRKTDGELEELIYEREELEISESRGRGVGKAILWTLAFFFIIALGFAFFSNFNKATVTVTPKTALAEGTREFVASRGAPAGKLAFTVSPVVRTGETLVSATEVKHVENRASGVIVVYNNFTEKPQRLIKNTRFESPSGLIYRIDHSVVLPGKTLQAGRMLPGSVETTVFAEAAGADYNIPLSDFTIPGFKSDPARFKGFYARSKTPMTGGFSGDVHAPSDAAAAAARAALRAQLESEARELSRRAAPAGSILFPTALTISFESLPLEPRGGGKSAIREKAAAAAFIFDRATLSKAIAAGAVKGYNGLPVEITNLDSLSFAFSERPPEDAAQAQTIRFTLSGNAQIVWLFDPDKLKNALLGKQKSDLAGALASFPTIEKMDVIIRPFWNRSFPDNPARVSIERAVSPAPLSRPLAPAAP